MMKENRAEILHDLLVKKSFQALSLAEKEFVCETMEESEYQQQHLVIASLSDAYIEGEHTPKALITPPTRTVRMIPLYQAIGATAAVAAIIIFTFSFFKAGTEIITNTEYVVQHDTIKVESVIYDTIFQNVQEKIYIQKDVLVQNSTTECYMQEPRLLESSPGIRLPDLNLVEIENSGTSLKDDATAILITDYLNSY